MGTALTGEQAREIGGLASVVLLCLDADAAGQQAAVRAASVLPDRLELRVVGMPAGSDPADIVGEEGGAERMRGAARGRGAVRALPDRADARARRATTRRCPRSPASSARCRRGSCAVSSSSSPRAASAITPELVESAVRTARAGRAARAATARGRARPANGARQALDRREQSERTFLALCVALPELGEEKLGALDLDAVFSSPRTRRAAELLRGHLATPSSILAEEPDLVGLVAELRDTANRLDATPATLELEALQLDLHRLDREISAARTGERARSEPSRRAPEGPRRDPAPPAVEPNVRPTHELVFVSWTRTGSRPNWPPAARSSRSRERWGSTRRQSATGSKKHGLKSTHAAKHAARAAASAARRSSSSWSAACRCARSARSSGCSFAAVQYWLDEVQPQDRAPPLLARATRRRRPSTLRECATHGWTVYVRSGARGLSTAVPHVRWGGSPRTGAASSEILVEEAGGRCAASAATTPTSARSSSTISTRRQKRFRLARGGLTRPLEQVREEARKCVLLCGNCHAEVEAGLVEVALPADTPG